MNEKIRNEMRKAAGTSNLIVVSQTTYRVIEKQVLSGRSRPMQHEGLAKAGFENLWYEPLSCFAVVDYDELNAPQIPQYFHYRREIAPGCPALVLVLHERELDTAYQNLCDAAAWLSDIIRSRRQT